MMFHDSCDEFYSLGLWYVFSQQDFFVVKHLPQLLILDRIPTETQLDPQRLCSDELSVEILNPHYNCPLPSGYDKQFAMENRWPIESSMVFLAIKWCIFPVRKLLVSHNQMAKALVNSHFCRLTKILPQQKDMGCHQVTSSQW